MASKDIFILYLLVVYLLVGVISLRRKRAPQNLKNFVGKPESGWCSQGDLNPQGFIHSILSAARIPIPPWLPEQNPDLFLQ